jgi:phage-related protein
VAVLGSAYVRIRAIGTDLVPDIQKSLNGINSVAEKGGKDFGNSFTRAFGKGGGDSFAAFRERAENTRVQLRKLNNAARFLAPAITGLLGAVGALGGGLVILGAAAGSAGRAFVVLPAALLALATAAITAKIAFGGVGEALSAGLKAQNASTGASKAQEAALRRVRDAQLALQRLLEEEAPAELAAARERAADAARSAADALLSAERTQRSFNAAQKETFDATIALTKAREDAVEKLQQLRFQTEGGAISERKARLEFEKARDSLQAVQDLPPNSRARQEAELAFAQAELNLRKAIDSNSDLKKEEAAATRAGIEGAEGVVSAKDALAVAQQREADLAIDTAKAFEAASRAQIAAAQAAADAAAGGSVERELNRRIADAREALRDAQKEAAAAASGGINQYQQALEKLSPAARAFVEFLVDSADAFREFRTAAGVQLFPALTSAVQTFLNAGEGIKPLLTETGGVVGEFADNLSTALFTGRGFETLRSVWSNNNKLLGNLGDAAVNLSLAFLEILNAAEPLITAFGEWASSSSAEFLANLRGDAEGLSETFANAERNFGFFAELIGNVLDGFGIIGGVINQQGGAGESFLTGLITRSEEWVSGLQAAADDGSLNTFFQGLSDSALALFDLIAEIGRVLLELGAQPGTAAFLESLKTAVTAFGDVGVALSAGDDSPVAALGRFIEKFAEFASALAGTEGNQSALVTFFDTLGLLIGKITDFVSSPEFIAFFDKWGPLIAQVAAFGLVFRGVQDVFFALAGTLLLPITLIAQFVGGIGNITNALGLGGAGGGAAGGGTLGMVFRAVGTAIRLLTGPIGLIIGAIVLMWQNSQMFRDSVMASFGALFDVFKNIWEDSLKPVFGEIGTGFGDIFGFLGELGRVFGDVLSFVMPLITVIVGAIAGLIGGLIEGFGGLVSVVTNIVGAIINIVRGIIGVFVGLFTGDFSLMEDAFSGLWENVKNIFKGIIRFILGGFRGLVNGFIDAWNGLAKRLVFKLPEWLGGWSFAVPQIPRIPDLIANLAMGGVVPATPYGTIARIGEAGRPERVEPLDPDGLSKRDKAMINHLTGGGGATINVYPSQGMDERELADMVSRKLAYQMRRGSV